MIQFPPAYLEQQTRVAEAPGDIMDDATEAAAYRGTAEKMWRWILGPFARRALRAVPPGGCILDLGTGPGLMPVSWAARRPDVSVTGVDLSPTMLRLAELRAELTGVADRVKFIQADATATGLPAGRYDVVVCHYMLHHFADPAAVLREMARLVKPGGTILARDLARPHPWMARLSTWFTKVFLRNTRAQNQQYADSLAASHRAGELRAAIRRAGIPDLVVSGGPIHVEVRRRPEPATAPRRMTHERVGRILAGASVIGAMALGYFHHPLWFLVVVGTGLNLALSGMTDRCAVKNQLIRFGFPGERDLGRREILSCLAADARRETPMESPDIPPTAPRRRVTETVRLRAN